MRLEKATFAAGRFWAVERAFRRIGSAMGTRGGHFENPTDQDACAGQTRHVDAVASIP